MLLSRAVKVMLVAILACQGQALAQGLVYKTLLEAGDNCLARGNYSEAVRNYRAGQNELKDPRSAEYRDVSLKISRGLALSGDYSQAALVLEKLLENPDRVSAIEQAVTTVELARLERLSGKQSAALEHGRLALAQLRVAARGKNTRAASEALSGALTGLALTLQEAGLVDQAEVLLKENISLKENGSGDLASAIEALARLRVMQDRFGEAEALLTKALDLSSGAGKVETVNLLLPLARVYFAQEKMEKGLGALKRALDICNAFESDEATTGGARQALAAVLDALSEHYCEIGDYKNALENARRLVDLRLRAGELHPLTAAAIARLADIEYNARDFEKSLADYKRAISITETISPAGKDSVDNARYLNELGLVYLSLGRYEESNSVYERALSLVQAARGKEHPDVATCFNNLALLRSNEGKVAEAESLATRGLELRVKLLGMDSPVVARNLVNLATILQSQKKYEAAEERLKQALVIQSKVYDGDHSEKAETMLNLARLYLESGRNGEALPILDKVLKADETIYGASSPPVISDLELTVRTLTALGKKEEAANVSQRLRSLKKGEGEKVSSDRVTTDTVRRPVRDKWALVIGVSSFKDTSINLKYAAKDATDFRNYLVGEAGFKADHVHLLTNEQATRENIVSELGEKWLSRRAHPDDLVVVYISSHGSAAKKEVNANFILPHEGNIHNVVLSGIPMQWFTLGIKEMVKADRTLLVLDVCHGGAAAEVDGNKAVSRVSATGPDLKSLQVGEGQLVLASSSADQLSWESINYQNSVFTRKLIEGLKLKGRETGITEAFAYMKSEVEEEVLRDRGELQAPVLRNSGWTGGDLAIACPTQGDINK